MAKIPKYVSECKLPGEIAKLGNDGLYHLFRRTSKRVAGESNPQNVLVETAIISPSEGRREISEVRRPIFEDFFCREVGFSFALKALLSSKWKAALKNDWENIFLTSLSRESPDSYLLLNKKIEFPEHRSRECQLERVWIHLPGGKETLDALRPLLDIRGVFFPDHITISKPSPEQQAILTRFNIELEGICI